MKKFFIFLAVIILVSCNNETAKIAKTNTSDITENTLVGNIPCKFPLVTKDTTLNFFIGGYGNIQASDVYVLQKYAEKTGVDINWTTVQKSKREESAFIALNNKQNVDLFMRLKLSSSLLTQYGKAGLIYDLAKDDLLKNNAPNCWNYLQNHKDTLASVTNPDGSIYSLPQVNAGPELRVSRKIFINKKWLENTKMEIPTTTEEFYQLLKIFKETDANGNGDPNDEIPFCSQDWISVQDALFGAFGLANRGVHNQIVDCDEATGNARFIASTTGYKNFLEYIHKLYSEELLDKYIFTISLKQWLNFANTDRVGVFSHTNLATLPIELNDNWVAVDQALEGPNGDKLWTSIRANFHSVGAAVIPTTCTNPELVLRWLDYFWTDEGTLFYHMGLKDDTFVQNADGSYDYSPKIYKEMQTDKVSFDDVVARYSPYPGGNNPTVEIAPYFRGGEMATIPAAAAKSLMQYGPKEYWPSFTFTQEENSRLEVIQSDITKYVKAMQIEFITGKKPFSEWQNYIDVLNQLGKDELVSIYQAAIDRYKKL